MPTRSPRFRFQMRQEAKNGLAVGNDSSAYKNGMSAFHRIAEQRNYMLTSTVHLILARVIPLDPMPICEMIPETNEDG